jgi:hypothetical protein
LVVGNKLKNSELFKGREKFLGLLEGETLCLELGENSEFGGLFEEA